MNAIYAMLQRNKIYTGVTRGKQLVVLVGPKRADAIAVMNVSGGAGQSSMSGCHSNGRSLTDWRSLLVGHGPPKKMQRCRKIDDAPREELTGNVAPAKNASTLWLQSSMLAIGGAMTKDARPAAIMKNRGWEIST